MIRRVLDTTAGATVVSSILAIGWAGTLLLVLLTLLLTVVLTIALCWVLADAERPARLALLLCAWKRGTPPPQRGRAESPITGTGRRKHESPAPRGGIARPGIASGLRR